MPNYDFDLGYEQGFDAGYEKAKEELNQPHGEWIKGNPWTTGVGMGEDYGYYYTCSKCGYKAKGGYKSCDIKFCQECGSDNRWKEGGKK